MTRIKLYPRALKASNIFFFTVYLALSKFQKEIEEQEETTVEGTDYSPKNEIELGSSPSLGSTITGVSTAQVTEQVSGQAQEEPVVPKVADVNTSLRMNIPDEDE